MSRSDPTRWLDAIVRESLHYKERFNLFDTIYLGGGTPSVLSIRQLALFFESIRSAFTFAPDTEVTLEANPGDLTRQRIAQLRSLGINRISLGIQSFNAYELERLGRRNTVEENERTLQWIRSEGSLKLAVDLIYGIKGQTRKSWLDSLDRALKFHPEHISCYQLTIAEDTPFGGLQNEGVLLAVDEDEQSEFFLMTSEYLESKGYLHYEVSNFARGPEHISRHNSKYWDHTPYLGLGPAAHSFLDGVRWWNFRSLEQYCRAVEEDHPPVSGSEILTAEELNLESLYLGLRTNRGIRVDETLGRGSESACAALVRLQSDGLIEVVDGRIVPTRKGLLVADSLPLFFVD